MTEGISPEQYKERLKSYIHEAQAAAPHIEELEKLKDRQDELVRLFIHGEIDRETFEKENKMLENNQGIISVDDPNIYTQLLKIIGFDQETIDQILADELPHFYTAKKEGLEPLLELQFLHSPDGLHAYPATRIETNDSLSDDDLRAQLIDIISAPEELSPRDRKQLGLEE